MIVNSILPYINQPGYIVGLDCKRKDVFSYYKVLTKKEELYENLNDTVKFKKLVNDDSNNIYVVNDFEAFLSNFTNKVILCVTTDLTLNCKKNMLYIYNLDNIITYNDLSNIIKNPKILGYKTFNCLCGNNKRAHHQATDTVTIYCIFINYLYYAINMKLIKTENELSYYFNMMLCFSKYPVNIDNKFTLEFATEPTTKLIKDSTLIVGYQDAFHPTSYLYCGYSVIAGQFYNFIKTHLITIVEFNMMQNPKLKFIL